MFATSDSLAGIRFPQLETRKAMIIINAQNDSLYESDEIYVCKNHDFIGRLKILIPYFRRIGDIIWVHTEMSQASKEPSPDAAKTEEAMEKNGDKSRTEQKVQDDELEDDTKRMDGQKEVSVKENPRAKSRRNGSPPPIQGQSYHPSSRTKSMMQRASAQARAYQRTTNMGVFNGDQGNIWEEKMIKSRKGHQKKFYIGGTYGAETCDELKPVVDESADMMLVKQYYSAFDQTALLTALRMRLVTELYICGSLTNVGVYSTAADAVQHGFEVYLVEDCLGYRSEEKHEEAMRQMADIMGANGVDSEELIAEAGGREVPDAEEPMFNGPGLNGINVGGLQIEHSQPNAEQVTRSPYVSHAGSDDSFPNSRSEAKRHANIIVKKPSSPNTVDEASQSSAKMNGDKQARKRGNKLSNQASPLPSPGISSTRSRGSLLTSAPLTMGPEDKIGAGDSKLILKVLKKPLREEAFALLKEEVDWQTMHHRGGKVPRLVAVQGEIEADGGVPVYRHPADESPPLLDFSPTVQRIRRQVERAVGQPLNHALIQLYRDGDDNISEHSDKTLDVVRGSSIINLSLGAQRVMTLRTKASKRQKGIESPSSQRQTQRIPMPHNSAFILGPKSNAHWLHGVRADKRPQQQKTEDEKSCGGERISITFRHIGTFMEEETRKIWGQGARGKTRATAGTIPRGNTAEMEAMVQAFGKENHQPDFDWDAHYGKGFDVINLINDKAKLSLCRDKVANLRVQLSLSEKAIPYILVQQSRPRSPESQSGRTQLQPWTHGLSNIQNVIFEDADEDTTVTEGDIAILFYLENINPSPAPQQASSDQAPNASALTFTRTTQSNELLYLWRQLKALPQAGNGSPHVEKRPTTPSSTPLSEFKIDMKTWEGYAKDSDYIAGDQWTVIDCAFWPVLHDIAKNWECFGRKTYPRLHAYHERILDRETVKALMAQNDE